MIKTWSNLLKSVSPRCFISEDWSNSPKVQNLQNTIFSQWSMRSTFWMRTKMPDLLFLSLSVITEFYVPIKSPYRIMSQFIKFIHCFCTSWPIDRHLLIFHFPDSLIRKFSNDLLPLRRKVFLNGNIFIGWEEFIWCLVRRKKNDFVAQYIHMSSVEEYILFLVTFSTLLFTVLLVYTSVIYFRCHFRNCVSSAGVKYTFH